MGANDSRRFFADDWSTRRVSTFRRRPIAACLAAAIAATVPAAGASDTSFLDNVDRFRIALERLSGSTLHSTRPSRPSGTRTALVVTNCDDHGAGSLRDVMAAVADADVIDLTHLSCSRITLTTGALATDHDRVVMIGPGADALTIDGSGTDRVIAHTGNWVLKLVGLSVTNGATDGKGGCLYSKAAVHLYSSSVTSCNAVGRGGAVYASSEFFMFRTTIADSTTQATGPAGGGVYSKSGFTGVVASTLSGNAAPAGNGGGLWSRDDTYISRSTLVGNSATYGGAFAASAPSDTIVSIAGSTISANSAARGAGVHADAEMRITDDTIAFNHADDLGGGLYALAAIALQNTIVSNNTQAFGFNDIAGAGNGAIAGANDLVQVSQLALPAGTLDVDPMLAPLADNGGPTMTHALISGSVAIDAGNNTSFLRYDQRGYGSARTIGAQADIGAYEMQGGATTTVASCADGGTGSLRDAIAQAKSGDTIDVSGLGCGTITLAGALPITVGSLTLIGPGAGKLTIDGGGTDRVLDHSGYGTLSVSGITFTHGRTPNDYGGGGCIRSASTLNVNASVIESCAAYGDSNSFGGGIMAGRLSLIGSTVSGNLSMATLAAKAGGVVVYGDFTMRDSTVSGNRAVTNYDRAEPKASSRGGGVAVVRGGTVDISGSTISGNASGNDTLKLPGYFAGLMVVYSNYMNPTRIINTTISGNTAASANGGLYVTSALALRNSTVAFNSAGTGSQYGDPLASGVHVGTLWADISSTVIAGNTTQQAGSDLGGAAGIFGANDLIMASAIAVPPDTLTDDPQLGPLQDNGGPTWTHALAASSPAVDHGNNGAMLADDQRGPGFARVWGAAADIGAYELQSGVPDAIFASGFDGS